MSDVTVVFSDGSRHTYSGAPDDVTPEQIAAQVGKDFPNRQIKHLAKTAGATGEFANVEGGTRTAEPAVDQTPLAPRMEPNLRGRAGVVAGASPEFQQNLDLSRRLRELEAQKEALYSRRGMTPQQKQLAFNDINNQIERMRQQQPTDLADVGGNVGNVVGGVGAGILAAPAAPATAGVGTALASAAGATGGAFIGRAAGAFAQMARSNYNDAEKAAYLDDKLGLKHIVIDALGNLVFMGAGGALGYIGKNTSFGRAVLNQLGFMVKQGAPGEASAIRPAFGEPGATANSTITSKEELAAAAGRAADTLSTGETTATKGAITGTPSRVEDLAKSLNPAEIKARQETLNEDLEKRLFDFRGLIEGKQSGETPGHTLERAFTGLEQRVKAFAGAAYDKLRGVGGDVQIDISDIRKAAIARLARAEAAPGTVPPGEVKALQNIVANGDRVTPEVAHDLQSALGAESRDLAKPGALDTRHKAAIDALANDIRSALSNGLEAAATQTERQMAMFNSQTPDAASRVFQATEQGAGTPNVAAAAGERAATRLTGAGEQKAMFAENPTIDPRLPGELRQAADAYRTMAQSVESSTGKKVLTAAETRGPEQVGAAIYAKGATTPIAEIRNLINVAEKVDKLPVSAPAAKALRDKAERLGFDPSRPLKEQFEEAHAGIVAEFMAKHLSTAEQLRNLPKTLADPANRRLFEAMLPGSQNRLLLEELSQQAQMIDRMGAKGSSLIGANHLLQSALGGGSIMALSMGDNSRAGELGGAALTFVLAPKALSHIMLRPTYVAELSRILALNARVLQGAGGSTLTELAQDFSDKMKADGYDILAKADRNKK